MKEYNIYANPQGSSEAVKLGWSWPGFFFNFFWALKKEMWTLGQSVFVFFFVLGLIEGGIEFMWGPYAALGMVIFITCLSLFVSIVFGDSGNEWRERKLRSSGYDYQDTVSASNPEDAIALWMKE